MIVENNISNGNKIAYIYHWPLTDLYRSSGYSERQDIMIGEEYIVAIFKIKWK